MLYELRPDVFPNQWLTPVEEHLWAMYTDELDQYMKRNSNG